VVLHTTTPVRYGGGKGKVKRAVTWRSGRVGLKVKMSASRGIGYKIERVFVERRKERQAVEGNGGQLQLERTTS
jgi:hypothetical protein